MPLSKPRARLTVAALTFAAATTAPADPIPVHHTQGAEHAFLLIRSQDGSASLGYGEFSQIADGDRITAHMVYRFRDGSVDDETTVYTQGKTFQFLSDHHIQRGPFFAKPSDITVQADGQVTTITPSKDGPPHTETQHIDLPNDVSNGMIGTLIANLGPQGPGVKLSMVAPVEGKGRLVHLEVTPDGQSSFTIAGTRRKATVYRLKIDLGGVIGVIAPIVNKQPHDIMLWVFESDPPLFVRELGQLSEGGPTVSIEFAGATFPRSRIPPGPSSREDR